MSRQSSLTWTKLLDGSTEMSKPKRKRAFKVSLSIGILLLATGVALWLYTDWVIKNHEQMLNNSDLTSQQRDAWQGSLEWWTDTKRKYYNPISVILIAAGLSTIECAIIYAIVQPKQKVEASLTSVKT